VSIEGSEIEEVSFLLRRFAEVIAPSLDVLSQDHHYRRRVLSIARESELVRYAACACAAKQLGHLSRPERYTEGLLPDGVFTKLNTDGRTDYLWYGAKYYGKAIQAMASELSQDIVPAFGTSPEELPWNGFVVSPTSSRSGLLTKDARLIAAEIMCYYEELSASWRALGRHLNGIFKILQLDQTSSGTPTADVDLSSILPWEAFSEGVMSRSFWRFVLNDCEQSCK
jgi:hypothetical protein